MISVAALLGLMPFVAAWLLFRRQQRGAALPAKNLARATCGGFCLAYVVALSASVRLDPPFDMAALAAGPLALLYLVVGAGGSRGAPFDVMAAILWSAGAFGCGWLFVAVVPALQLTLLVDALPEPAASLVHPVLVAGCIAAGVACVVRVVLMLWPVPGPKLPNPAKIPGMPIAGPASASAAHAAMSQSGTARPKFKV